MHMRKPTQRVEAARLAQQRREMIRQEIANRRAAREAETRSANSVPGFLEAQGGHDSFGMGRVATGSGQVDTTPLDPWRN